MPKPVFLRARWEYLAMLNYVVAPEVLYPHLPPGTELDLWNGHAMVSMVGFMFMDTRVLGIRWPGHVSFEEVNLRYYIKHFDGATWKRGVGFVSEIVPRHMIARMANRLYNEHYSALPMRHAIQIDEDTVSASYEWLFAKKWNALKVTAHNRLHDIEPGSQEEFILEHYWGYNGLNKTTSIEYGVEHPRWQVYLVTDYLLDADIAKLYGKAFAPYIQDVKPLSVFLAKGSEVIIRRPGKFIAS